MRKTSSVVPYPRVYNDRARFDLFFRYSTVVRGTNAYVPPGARKPSVLPPPGNNVAKAEIPKVSVNGPDGTSIPASQTQSPPSSKTTSPAPSNKVNFSCETLGVNDQIVL